MESFKESLNKIKTGYTFITFKDLEQGKPYEINSFQKIKSKFGKKLSVILNDDLMLILPDRFTDEYTDKQITWYNTTTENKLNLIYKGEINLKNGKTMYDFSFN